MDEEALQLRPISEFADKISWVEPRGSQLTSVVRIYPLKGICNCGKRYLAQLPQFLKENMFIFEKNIYFQI